MSNNEDGKVVLKVAQINIDSRVVQNVNQSVPIREIESVLSQEPDINEIENIRRRKERLQLKSKLGEIETDLNALNSKLLEAKNLVSDTIEDDSAEYIHILLGLVNFALKDYQFSTDHFKSVCTIIQSKQDQPQVITANTFLAMSLLSGGNTEQSIEKYLEVVELVQIFSKNK